MSMLDIGSLSHSEFFRRLDVEKEKRMKENSQIIEAVETKLEKSKDGTINNEESVLELIHYIDAVRYEEYYNTYYMLWVSFDVQSFNHSLNENGNKEELYKFLKTHIEKPDVIPDDGVCISYWMNVNQKLNDYINPMLKFKDIEYSSDILDKDYTNLKSILSEINTKLSAFVSNNVTIHNMDNYDR